MQIKVIVKLGLNVVAEGILHCEPNKLPSYAWNDNRSDHESTQQKQERVLTEKMVRMEIAVNESDCGLRLHLESLQPT